MLDVQKEISKYEFIGSNQEINTPQKEFEEFIQIFTKTFDRIGREQYKSTQKIEDVLSILEEDNEMFRQYQDLEKKVKNLKEENKGFIQSIINIMDLLEEIYRYVLRSSDSIWKDQLLLQWKRAEQFLNQYEITRIEGIGSKFMLQLHAPKEVKNYTYIPNEHILDIIRSGYMYRGQVIRKAEVIVNSNEERMKEVE